MGAGEAVLAVFKDLGYWNGVVKKVALPPLKALAGSTDNTWDDSLVAMGEGLVDKLLPPSPPAA